jgi:hypothetical protein
MEIQEELPYVDTYPTVHEIEEGKTCTITASNNDEVTIWQTDELPLVFKRENATVYDNGLAEPVVITGAKFVAVSSPWDVTVTLDIT